MQSEKKICNFLPYSLSVDCVLNYVDKFHSHFIAHHYDNSGTAKNYVLGLLKCSKGEANMERMEEEIEKSEYRAYQQFISNSNWDSPGLQKSVAQEASALLSSQKEKRGLDTGYIIDESGHMKKGKMSVGVSRQYAGVSGKVDNCQVGVYSSLVNEKYATIINERIFLPKTWTEDEGRCEKAGIPTDERIYKTKPELAFDMIEEDIERGVKFDWIGGDGLYGHNTELCRKLESISQFYVLDVHKDECVYLEEPTILITEKTTKKGKVILSKKANKVPVRLDELFKTINPKAWKTEVIRDTTKGKLKLKVYKLSVWYWNKKDDKAIKRTIIITKTLDKKPKIKFSVSNGDVDEYSCKQYAYFVSQRYWVERTFDNAKNELGMSDYQIRKWKSWHNHHSLLFLTSLLIMKQQIDNVNVPLLSFRDARILIILQVFGSKKEIEIRLKQMDKRHKKRQKDIDYNYRIRKESPKILTS